MRIITTRDALYATELNDPRIAYPRWMCRNDSDHALCITRLEGNIYRVMEDGGRIQITLWSHPEHTTYIGEHIDAWRRVHTVMLDGDWQEITDTFVVTLAEHMVL